MRVQRTDIIADLPAMQVRDFLRKLAWEQWSADAIADHFGMDVADGRALIEDLIKLELLERGEPFGDNEEEFFGAGANAARLAAARVGKPISRNKAESLVADLLLTIEQANANSDFLYKVGEARLFGSHIDPSRADLGDVDVAVRLAARPQCSPEELTRLKLERADGSGKRFRNRLSRLLFAEEEVRSFIKGKQSSISLHGLEDLERIGAQSQVLFQAD